MQSAKRRGCLLTNTVLASTLFVNSLSYAATIIHGTVGQQTTSITGDIEVAPDGQIFTNALDTDGIQNNTDSITIILDPFNTTNNPLALLNPNNNAIVTLGPDSQGIHICGGGACGGIGSNANIIIGQGTDIYVQNTANDILVHATNANILNAGQLIAVGLDANSINLDTSGTNAKITNTSTGLMTSFSGSAILVDEIGSQISNSGTLSSSIFSAIFFNKSFTSLTNNAGGIISGTAGASNAIQLGGGTALTGDVQNSGTIFANSTGSAIRIAQPFTGSITNNVGGAINNTKSGGTAITANASFTSINNGGSIAGTVAGSNAIVIKAGATAGIINNLSTGIIQSNNTSTIQLGGSIKQIVNAGTIATATALAGGDATIAATANNITLNLGIINTGIITDGAGGTAIDLQSAGNNINVPLIQNSGGIAGRVLLASAGGTTLTMNGGIINGDVETSKTSSSTLDLNGGTIGELPTQKLNVWFNNNTINLAGTDLQIINSMVGNNTYNATGGSFSELNGKAGDVLNVNKTFTIAGPVTGVPTINVNNAGTVLTVNQPISLMSTLTVNPNTSMVVNAGISGAPGDIINNGSITVNGTQTFDLGGGSILNGNPSTLILGSNTTLNTKAATIDFTNGANLSIGIASTSKFGDLVNNQAASAITFFNGSTISPLIEGFIPQGSIFNIVRNNGGTITDNSTLIQPSLMVQFTKEVIGGNTLRLLATRSSFLSFSGSSVTKGIAENLDELASGNGPTDPLFIDLLSQFELLQTPQAIEQAMQSLIPNFNYGLLEGSYAGFNHIFKSVNDHIQLFHLKHRYKLPNFEDGLSFGDELREGSGWGQFFAGNLDQGDFETLVPGYKGTIFGGIIGASFGVSDCSVLGFAGSYSKVIIKDKNDNPKNEAILNLQGTLYGTVEFRHGLYLDAMIGLARDSYSAHRTIHVNQLTTGTNANFNGTQYGMQSDLGWSVIEDPLYYVSPFATVRYNHLAINDYTEHGAGGLSLKVSYRQAEELMGGIGFRAGATFGTPNGYIIPADLLMMLGYDFRNTGEQSLANFLGAGSSFITNGLTPSPIILNIGLALSGRLEEDSIFTFKYNLEARSRFLNNSFYLQYTYCFLN